MRSLVHLPPRCVTTKHRTVRGIKQNIKYPITCIQPRYAVATTRTRTRR